MRRDKRGRCIGRNLWRDHITDAWFYADQAWQRICEQETAAYPTEVAEYQAHTPRPNLGDFMVALAPSWGRAA